MSTMKAIGFTQSGGVEVLKPVEVPKPTPLDRDLLVKVIAIGMNPIDTKVRKRPIESGTKIIGWDASGIVEQVGKDCKLFKVGDEVYFAGSIVRQGCNAEYVAVDERIVGHKPKTLSWEEAAALPLVTLTGWEGIIEQMKIPIPKNEEERKKNAEKTIMITAGAGGAGSIAIQIAKVVLNLKVIATASRSETVQYCKDMGADFVINHKEGFSGQLKKIGFNGVDYIYHGSELEGVWDALIDALNPLGTLCGIVGCLTPQNILKLMMKKCTFTYEYMFSRSQFGYDMEYQGHILNELADLVDKKQIKHNLTTVYENMSFLSQAHKQQESGTSIGKHVIKAIF